MIEISEVELQRIQEALDSARAYTALFDLQDSLRKLNRQNRSSPLTLALDAAYDIASKYLEKEDND